jgi:hypothetical protein
MGPGGADPKDPKDLMDPLNLFAGV